MSKVIEAVKGIKEKYNEMSQNLLKEEVMANIQELTSLNRKVKKLVPVIEKYNSYIEKEAEYKDALKLINSEKDPEMISMYKQIIDENRRLLEQYEADLKVLLLPKDPNDDKDIIMEIRGAAGGDEANIFAGDLYKMYMKFAETKGWKIELIDLATSEMGGYSYLSMFIKGEDVYAKLKFENGVHRVQRVPRTETLGRVHTSTASVVVMPEIEAAEININPADLRIDTFRAGGAGGQHVNKTESAIRITHIPTGVVVACSDGKSQHSNRDKAMTMVRAKVYEKYEEEKNAKIGNLRKTAVGTGDRSEKIRTYNYPQNRLTDHRIKLTINNLDNVMEGRLDDLINALIADEQRQLLEDTTKE